VDVINTVIGAIQGFVDFFRNLVPGGWGLILLPLGILAFISLWFGIRNR
jgi:hypothetical protein